MKHYDCKYLLMTDAFKGICKRDKSKLNIDGAACENFEKARKCKYCSNFTPTGNEMGKCMSRYDAYPEMNAVTCNDFKN